MEPCAEFAYSGCHYAENEYQQTPKKQVQN